MSERWQVDVAELAGTERLGRALGNLLFPGAVVALVGTLGAGKTHLVRAVAKGMGIDDAGVVTSPTFVLIQEYQGPLPLFHFDAYRLHGAAEFWELGPQEYFQGNGVCIVEWADKVAECLPADHLHVDLAILGPTSRRFTFAASGPKHQKLLDTLRTSDKTP